MNKLLNLVLCLNLMFLDLIFQKAELLFQFFFLGNNKYINKSNKIILTYLKKKKTLNYPINYKNLQHCHI